MATSGTATFNLDIGDIIEEAFEQAGLEARTGNDVRTARRSLNLLSIDWANRGIPMWTLEQGTVPLIAGTAAYNLPVDTMDILEHTIRTTEAGATKDIPITRISMSTYATIPAKASTGRPVQMLVSRGTTPTVTFWPVPNSSSYTLVYWRMRRIQDTGTSGEITPDIPYRFLPCLVAGLAYYVAKKRPEAHARLPQLKADYEELWLNASTEDRERASWFVTPDIGG
jgi:hypothetical protein